MKRAMAFLLSAMILPAPAVCDPAADLARMRAVAATDIGPGDSAAKTLEQFLQEPMRLRGLFARFPVDIAYLERAEPAEARANMIASLLKYDLDGDGMVTAEERDALEASTSEFGETRRLRDADRNKDGAVDAAEIRDFAEVRSRHARGRTAKMRLLDLDGDGFATKEEFERVSAALTYYKALSPTISPACAPPPPGASAEVVLLSGYSGFALPNVTVAGPDVGTTLARIVVEPGDRPLYIFATSFAAIVWQIEGATERVERFVLQPGWNFTQGTGAGILGLPADRVSFLTARACIEHLTEAEGGEATLARATLREALGRVPDHTVASYRISEVSLPSGILRGGESGDRHGLERVRASLPLIIGEEAAAARAARSGLHVDMHEVELARRYPGGVIAVDPGTVVSGGAVERYGLLPGVAGLMQLLARGQVRDTGDGFILIRAQIERFPAGLHARYILGRGLAMPAGNPGGSPVYAEETGECLVKRCMR